MKKISGIFFLLAALTACATKPHVLPDIQPMSEKGSVYSKQATVYVLRDDSKSGVVWPVTVKSDKVVRGSLRRETYIKFAVTPGKHNIFVEWPALSGEPDVAINAEFLADNTYYFTFKPRFGTAGLYLHVWAFLEQTGPRSARNLMSFYKDRTPAVSEK